MSSIIKGITDEQHITKKEPEVHVPGYGTMPLDMLKRHVQELSKDFNTLIQQGAFLKAAYRSEQFYNALMALAKALPKPDKVDETHSTGTTVGSAGIGGGVGLGIDKSPIEKVIEKPLGEGELPPKAGFNKKPHKVGPGTSKDDYEYKSFIPRDRKEKGEEWAIARDVRNINSKVGKKKPKELDTGFYKNYLGNRPVREGDVVSMQARKTPLVVAGNPYDWDIYDLRNNKMVASIIGGDRHDSPLYEVRINRNGMTESTKMLPTYVVTAGANNEPPYRVYELEVPSEVDKIEKSPGPGGTTKLKPDGMDVVSHIAKQTAKGKYYGYDMYLVDEGLDQYQIVEKALGAKIMDIDDAMELGYTDEDPEDSSGIIYVGNKVDEAFRSMFYNMPPSLKDRKKLRAQGKRTPLRKYTELAQMLGITFDQLNGLRQRFPDFPKPVPGVAGAKHGAIKYFRPDEFQAWLDKHNIKELLGLKKEVSEEQAPMFTPEAKMVNANDPMSDGWRVYKAQPAGSKDDIDEVSNFLALRQKDDEFKKIFGTTPLYKEGDKIVTKFSDKTPNVKGVVIDFDPKTKKTLIKAEDGNKYFVHAQNLSKVNKESSIMKGIQVENESSKGK